MSKRSRRSFIRTLFIVLAEIVITLCVIDVLFPLFVPVSDYPYVQADAQLGIRRIPNQSGRWVYRGGEEVNVHWHTNAQGWISSYDYITARAGVPRIAVVGDSYVEAQNVETSESFPEQLQQYLPCEAEVYRFGMSGASLAQYWAILQEAVKYQPDITVISIVGNDFEQSLGPNAFGLHWYFRPDGMGRFVAVKPMEFEADWLSRLLDHSSLRRYIRGNLMGWIVESYLVTQPRELPDVQPATREEIEAFVPFILAEYQQIAEANDTRLILTLESDRATLYGIDPSPLFYPTVMTMEEARQLVMENAAALGIPIIDLTPVFEADYAATGEQLNFQLDLHWNRRGNQIVGEHLANQLASEICK
ncbi:MAG: hypothetical protein JXB30_13030 [Anaerolineae bacterium]|nr:hypothetical protein [Anaerolineae bacterium]